MTPISTKRKRPANSPGLKWEVATHQANVSFVCPLCHGDMHLTWAELDHCLALIDGGKHERENLRLICTNCHREKSAREHIANCKAKRLASGGRKSKNPMPKLSEPQKQANRERRKEWRAKLKLEGRL